MTIYFDSFVDECVSIVEITKEADARWRRAMRAGELGATELKKLHATARPAAIATGKGSRKQVKELTKGPLLSYDREISGLERGTDALAKKHNVRILTGTAQGGKARQAEGVAAIRRGDVVGGAKKWVGGLGESAVAGMARHGGGAVGTPVAVFVDPKRVRRNLRSGNTLADRGNQAMVRRHEMNEALVGRKTIGGYVRDLASGRSPRKSTGYVPRSAPVELNPKQQLKFSRAAEQAELRGRSASVQPAVAEKAGGVLRRVGEKLQGSKVGPKLQSIGARVEQTAGGLKKRIRTDARDRLRVTPEGRVAHGRHVSPEVILRESADVAMMPPSTQRSFRRARRPAESKQLQERGITYGTKATPQARRRVLKAFEEDRL